ncbi:MAG: hypothetical protein JRJ57_04055 [Deltaproteobacteria bacterium]|nr:hypothetical protein [Deltaproteobacteria bacterium]
MSKFGLFLDFIGFIMLFWQSAVRPTRNIDNGGGFSTSPADEDFQMEKALNWIPSKLIRCSLAKHWQVIAFGLISIGVLFQLFSCS